MRFFLATVVSVGLFVAASGSGAVPGSEPAGQALSAADLLQRSIEYHDPVGAWATGVFRLSLSSGRPDGSVRETAIEIDNTVGGFTLFRTLPDGGSIEAQVQANNCRAEVNDTEATAEQIDDHDLGCAALQRTRNYHVYLYGLPMKLRDPGTILHDTVQSTTFQDRDVYALKVSYDPAVGSDTWYFYFDPATFALVGYRFYHDESANDGEYIVLEEEAIEEANGGGSVRLPKVRSWYMNIDDRYLGTDTITGVERRRRP